MFIDLLTFVVGEKIMSVDSKKTYEVQEVGIMYPDEYPTDML